MEVLVSLVHTQRLFGCGDLGLGFGVSVGRKLV